MNKYNGCSPAKPTNFLHQTNGAMLRLLIQSIPTYRMMCNIYICSFVTGSNLVVRGRDNYFSTTSNSITASCDHSILRTIRVNICGSRLGMPPTKITLSYVIYYFLLR